MSPRLPPTLLCYESIASFMPRILWLLEILSHTSHRCPLPESHSKLSRLSRPNCCRHRFQPTTIFSRKIIPPTSLYRRCPSYPPGQRTFQPWKLQQFISATITARHMWTAASCTSPFRTSHAAARGKRRAYKACHPGTYEGQRRRGIPTSSAPAA